MKRRIVLAFAALVLLVLTLAHPGTRPVYPLADGSQVMHLSAADPTTLALQVQELASEKEVVRVVFEGDPRRPTGALVIFREVRDHE